MTKGLGSFDPVQRQLTMPFFFLLPRPAVRKCDAFEFRGRKTRLIETPGAEREARRDAAEKAETNNSEDLSGREVTKNDTHTSCLNCEKHSRREKYWDTRALGHPIPGQNVSKTWASSVTNRSPDRSRFPPRLTRRLFVSRETKFRPVLCPLTYVVHTSGPIVIIASSLLTRSLAWSLNCPRADEPTISFWERTWTGHARFTVTIVTIARRKRAGGKETFRIEWIWSLRLLVEKISYSWGFRLGHSVNSGYVRTLWRTEVWLNFVYFAKFLHSGNLIVDSLRTEQQFIITFKHFYSFDFDRKIIEYTVYKIIRNYKLQEDTYEKNLGGNQSSIYHNIEKYNFVI